MENNIISHINSQVITSKVESIVEEMGLVELKIVDYEEFFHAITHFKPALFIVEISDEFDSYLKIIRILKKSNLTNDIPILVVVENESDELLEIVSKQNIDGVVYPPVLKSLISLYIKKFVEMSNNKKNIQFIQEIQTVHSVMISGLATLAEYRDPETGEHIKRTQNYVKALAMTLMRRGFFLDELTIENIESMYMSIPLHDIGKVGIRDDILLKPGKLSAEEFEIMKTHSQIGYETIMSVGNRLKNSAFLEYAADVAYTHHEKYDGSGYPRGIKGLAIPLVGRLMAVADVYDALISKRIYKNPMTHDEAVAIIKDGKGSHFDPIIVDCMLSLESTFRNISSTYKDYENGVEKYVTIERLRTDDLLKNILIVEDSRIVREITRNQLNALGFEVDVAVDGEEGIEALKKHDYDLVILDIEMPRMNGYDMALQMKKINTNPVLIVMTATNYNISQEDLERYDISGVILKPIDFNRLAAIYEEALR